jgi:hypothetical protein
VKECLPNWIRKIEIRVRKFSLRTWYPNVEWFSFSFYVLVLDAIR